MIYAAVLLAALLPPAGVLAAPDLQSSDLSLDVQAGYDGYYQEGQWVPLRVQVSNDGPDVDAVLRAVDDASFAAEVVYSRPIELPSGSRKEVFLYFSNDGYVSSLDVELVANNRRLASTNVLLRQVGLGDVLYGILSDNPSAFSDLGLVAPISGNAQVAVLTVDDLPPVAEAWRALDVLVFSDVDTGQLNAQQREAMHAWVTSGGRVIVSGGPGWTRTAAGLDTLLPVQGAGSATLSNLSSFAEAMGLSGQDLNGEAFVTEGQPLPGAQVAVSQDGVPLWVWQEIGLGRVDYLAMDPALEPLRSSPNMETLWRSIMVEGSSAPSWSQGFVANWYYAREAVVSIPGVSLPSALQLCGFLSVYVMIIGPLNYIVLRRMKRTELAWVTVPGVVLLFSAMAYVTGYQVRGSRAILHRLTLVQSWSDSEVARVDSVIGLWSPRRSTYDLRVGENLLAQPLPGDYGGGLGASANRLIEQTEGSTLRGVRVDVGAVQSFLVEGYAPAVHVDSDLSMTLDSGGGLRVDGEVWNDSGVDLEDAVLLAAGAAQQLGDLPDGDSASINLSLLSGYATAASVNGFQVVPGGAGSVPANYGGYAGYDSTVDDILGTSYCYGSNELQRRCNLLRAAIDQYAGVAGRGPGVYLVGWSDESPVDVSVVDANSANVDTSVYFFALPVTVEQVGQSITVPPSLMTWSQIDMGQSYSSYAPYEIYLSPTMEGPVAFRYEPLPIVSLGSVTGLTVHIEGYQPTSNIAPPNVELWDWSESKWEVVSVNWGDSAVPQPERFVNRAGAVHLRLWVDNTSQGISVDRVDVTLEGVPPSRGN